MSEKKSVLNVKKSDTGSITIPGVPLYYPVIDWDEAKRRIDDASKNFQPIPFTVYLIFAISTAILIGYLIAQNSSGDSNTQNRFITWGLFIASIVIFIINRVLVFFNFQYKTIILAIIMIIQTGLSASALIAARNFGYIGNNFTDLYYVAHGMNILTTALGLVPLYYSSDSVILPTTTK